MSYLGWFLGALRAFSTPKAYEIEGSFTCAGAAAATSPKGRGYTVRRTGTGTYVVTFTRNFKAVVHVAANLLQATGGNDAAFAVSYTLGTATTPATLTIETQSSAGTAANLAAGEVHFRAVFTDATLTAPASTSV